MKRTKLKRTTRLAGVFLAAIVFLLIVAVAAYMLFISGYVIGVRSKDVHKTGIKQELCFHDWYGGTGVCLKCGAICSHANYNDDYNCELCGFHHEHTFEESAIGNVCSKCGTPCQHKQWSKGYCKECDFRCTHPDWIEDECVICGLYCKHLEYKDGYCVICGLPCVHKNWENGICKACGFTCEHGDHDTKSQQCFRCGMKTYHRYVQGICSCGTTPQFYSTILPYDILSECRRQGTVTTVTYQTRKYNEDNSLIYKNMDIYTPYGYDPNQRYDVLILIHGGGGHYYEWSSNPLTIGSYMSSPRNIYDNMIDQALCKPLIIASITTLYYGANGETDSGAAQMSQEIRNDIVPFICENYSTYAASPTARAVSAVREHFGIGGLSNGSLYAYNSGMIDNFDLFGNYACFSGSPEAYEMISAINSNDNIELPISTYFVGAGGYDSQRMRCYNGFTGVVDSTDRLQPGENAFFYEVSENGHDWVTWTTLIYDALLVLFEG